MRRRCLTVFASATATSKPRDETASTPAPVAPRFRNSRRVKPVKPLPSALLRFSERKRGELCRRAGRPSTSRGGGHRFGEDKRLVQRAAGFGAQPAGHRSGDALGSVGGLSGEIEDRLQLVGGRRLCPQLLGVGGDPFLGVHPSSSSLGFGVSFPVCTPAI